LEFKVAMESWKQYEANGIVEFRSKEREGEKAVFRPDLKQFLRIKHNDFLYEAFFLLAGWLLEAWHAVFYEFTCPYVYVPFLS